jgi:hypothetical protein
LDFNQSNKLRFGGYYDFSDSSADERGAPGLSLNTLGRIFNRSHTMTGRTDFTPSPNLAGEVRINYSRLSARSSYQFDNFGGAVLPFFQDASQSRSVSADLNGRATTLMSAADANNTQRQFNIVGSIALVSGTHQWKFGVDYRRLFPIIGLADSEQTALFDGVSQALTGVAARINSFSRTQPKRPVFDDFAAYAQDEWRSSPRLTFTYGLRWQVNPAPHNSNLLAVTEVADPSRLTSRGSGERLWETRFGNFAPRVGVSYQLNHAGTFVVRSAFGVLYDATNKTVGDALAESYPLLSGGAAFNVPFSFSPVPIGSTIATPFFAFDPKLKSPYSIQWNASIEREFGSDQVISASYVASANHRLLLTNTLVDQNAVFALVRLTNNDGESNYRSLQIQFRRRFSKRFGATAGYTWGRSVDNLSEDSAARALFRAIDSQLERGPSDFDVRHTLTGFVWYDLHNPFGGGAGRALFRNWSVASVFNMHSATAVNVVYGLPTTYGFLYLRPDLIPGASLYLMDPTAAGSKRINPAAFAIPADLRQGTLGRNTLRGFGLTQFDASLQRRFNFTEYVRLVVGVQAANIFNDPSFAAPNGSDASLGTRFSAGSFSANPTFGEAVTNTARGSSGLSAGTFGPNYFPGGPRSVKFSARLEF